MQRPIRLPERFWRYRAVVPLALLLSTVSAQLGTAIAAPLLATAGVAAVAVMRNGFSAALLAAISRPTLRGRPARHWRYAVLLGVVTTVMNLSFYAAVTRIPLGVAVAIDFLGPITVAALGTKRAVQFVWPALAYAAVLLLTPITDITALDPLGLALAGVAACGWGSYILVTARTSALFGDISGLTLATGFGALAALPMVLLDPTPLAVTASVLVTGAVVAVLSTALPFSLEYAALRHSTPRTVGILLSAEPAVAALIGLLVLGQQLDLVAWIAVALVTCASIGVLGDPASAPPPDTDTDMDTDK